MTNQYFTEPDPDDLLERHDNFWRDMVAEAGVPLLDGDEDPVAEAISSRLPYRWTFDPYLRHVARCAECGGQSILTQCAEGDRLSAAARRGMEDFEAAGARQ